MAAEVKHMLSENIKRLRAESGMSQEELAARLAVVRQTVSKWERGMSVPDADMVVRLAELFGVPVSELLGTQAQDAAADLAAELARANSLLAEKAAAERTASIISRRRGAIIALCFLALVLALAVDAPLLSLALISLCLATALFTLWRSLALLTGPVPARGLRAVKVSTIFDAAVFACVLITALFSACGVFMPGAEGEKWLAAGIIAAVMVFSGIISPRLPFNRHTGLRLPWTVTNDGAWNAAHAALGFTAIPVALLYLAAAAAFGDFEAVTLTAVLAWLGIPALVSLLSYLRPNRDGY